MTAMPPTTGHLQLIQFANLLADDGTTVIVCTQPHEPLPHERYRALVQAAQNHGLTDVIITHLHKTIEQNPEKPGFWAMWRDIMTSYGVTTADYIVASEPYGQKVAELTGSQFFPYDIDRELNHTKATPVRSDPLAHYTDIVPEFQQYIQTRVTVFGAESTGKTTLSRQIAKSLDADWLFEYARPYLENTVNEITHRSMTAIWKGQAALQRQIVNLASKPIVIQDTDLYSTVGYWEFPQWQPLIGDCPDGLKQAAAQLRSDLYIVTKSNIPFEQDPLRYGGDKREGSDEYWIDICERYELPYVVLETSSPTERLAQSLRFIRQIVDKKAQLLTYDRKGL